ncbi:MAG TPA: response regulator [Thermodesulfobacteriota bacterium]|nr:response regulator [Thermodesulfobacteriota bacterium]
MMKILIIDDEPNIRLVYSEVLNDEGYEVLEAESGKEVFQILYQEPIDLIILDIKLRIESGLNVLQKITEEFPDIPVLILSAYTSFQREYTSWFAKNYILKSSDTSELLEEINKALSADEKLSRRL